MCFHLDICINHNVHPSNDFIKFMANTYFIKNKIFNVCTYILNQPQYQMQLQMVFAHKLIF